jgi:sulfur carrier protein
MRIFVNGAAHEVASVNVDAVLQELGFNDRVVATARNGEFVALNVRAATALAEGDQLEVLAPMQGG